jgi:NAD(P)H-dependent FMN reductase
MKAVVILGSVREGRLCERVGRYVEAELTKRFVCYVFTELSPPKVVPQPYHFTIGVMARNFSVSVLDPKVEKFPLLEKPFHFYKPEEEVPAFLAEWAAKLQQADAIVVVSGSLAHTYTHTQTHTHT